jgi:hypothetical protein
MNPTVKSELIVIAIMLIVVTCVTFALLAANASSYVITDICEGHKMVGNCIIR